MRKLIGFSLLVIGAAALATAVPVGAPEIDPASGGSALALLAGALVIFQGRRRKQ